MPPDSAPPETGPAVSRSTVRLMPGHDPGWRDKFDAAAARLRELRGGSGALNDEARREFLRCQREAEAALDSSFRTTAEYRDFHFARARRRLEEEGVEMPLPPIADDATVAEIDAVLEMAWHAIEITNSENF